MHRFVNDLERSVGTFLLGRRLYEVLVYWETVELDDQPEHIRDFAEIWRGAEKVVYSKTLETVSSAGTRIERTFDPEEVRRLKSAVEGDLGIGGPDLAAAAFGAGLVDEVHLFVAPISVGGGKPFLPVGVRMELELLGERRFGNGFVYLGYGTRKD